MKSPKSFISIVSLKKSYGDNEVIKEFSLNIKAGEVVCLLGTNGSGKTTLVNMLTGLEKLDEDDKGNAYITTKTGN
jgi:ABC-type Fe3+/spermidine/putrescine transport system ATPase subunit